MSLNALKKKNMHFTEIIPIKYDQNKTAVKNYVKALSKP